MLHFDDKYSVTPIFSFLSNFLSIAQFIKPITSFLIENLCARFKDEITNLKLLFHLS